MKGDQGSACRSRLSLFHEPHKSLVPHKRPTAKFACKIAKCVLQATRSGHGTGVHAAHNGSVQKTSDMQQSPGSGATYCCKHRGWCCLRSVLSSLLHMHCRCCQALLHLPNCQYDTAASATLQVEFHSAQPTQQHMHQGSVAVCGRRCCCW
jgi:hypothetical protein